MTVTPTPAVAGAQARRRRLRRSGAIVAVMVAIGAAFALIPSIGSADGGAKCESESQAVSQARTALDELDRTDYTSGGVGGAEFNAEKARLEAEKLKADRAQQQCRDDDEGDTPRDTIPATTVTTAPPAGSGTPDDPYVGDAGNTNPVLSEVRSYQSLVKALVAESGRGRWYTDDLQQFNGITRDDILRAAKLEEQGHDLRLILISNSNLSDSEARAQLKAQGVKEVDRLPIVRVNGFINTRGLPNDRMDPFEDNRSQVRVSLGIPNDWNDLSKGLQADRGILTMCGNGWKLKAPKEAPPATSVPEQPSTPHTTQPPATTAPPTTAPPVTQPPATTAPPVTTTRPPVTTTRPPTTTLPPKLCGGPGQPSCTGTPSR